VYRELHDNEWTDALQGLTGAGHDDEEATATLYLTLLVRTIIIFINNVLDLDFKDFH
jgi:hypothetical protein